MKKRKKKKTTKKPKKKNKNKKRMRWREEIFRRNVSASDRRENGLDRIADRQRFWHLRSKVVDIFRRSYLMSQWGTTWVKVHSQQTFELFFKTFKKFILNYNMLWITDRKGTNQNGNICRLKWFNESINGIMAMANGRMLLILIICVSLYLHLKTNRKYAKTLGNWRRRYFLVQHNAIQLSYLCTSFSTLENLLEFEQSSRILNRLATKPLYIL